MMAGYVVWWFISGEAKVSVGLEPREAENRNNAKFQQHKSWRIATAAREDRRSSPEPCSEAYGELLERGERMQLRLIEWELILRSTHRWVQRWVQWWVQRCCALWRCNRASWTAEDVTVDWETTSDRGWCDRAGARGSDWLASSTVGWIFAPPNRRLVRPCE